MDILAPYSNNNMDILGPQYNDHMDFLAPYNIDNLDILGPRDGKSLQNSTSKALSLKSQHTKYLQKMLKIVQKGANMQKQKKNFEKLYEKKHSCKKSQHTLYSRCGHFFPSLLGPQKNIRMEILAPYDNDQMDILVPYNNNEIDILAV